MVQKMKYMMAACFLMVATTCMAMLQQKPGDGEQPRDGKRPRPNMEQFVKSQATRIAQSLKLDGETSKKFIQTFYNCRKEMAATMKRYPHKKRSEMTDAEVDKAIRADFKQGRKMLDIREKYYAAYSRFLFSIYSGFVLHLLKSKKKKVFFLISIVYIIFWCMLIFWHCMSSM